MMTVRSLLTVVVLVAFAKTHATPLRFKDVTRAAGIAFTPADKTSASSIGDLNQDGFLDIVQCNHAREKVEVFYGGAGGKFTRFTAFPDQLDRHGTAIGDSNNDGFPDIIISNGITTLDKARDPPMIEQSNGTVGGLTLVSGDTVGLTPTYAQGATSRVAVRMADLDNDGDLDMYLIGRNYSETRPQHTVFVNDGTGQYTLDKATGAERGKEFGFLFTDYNQDGLMDIMLLQQGVQLFRNDGKGRGGISFTDVTDIALPKAYARTNIGGGAELDYDNDGDFDIYLSGGNRVKGPPVEGDDILLENNGDGTFGDASLAAGLPRGGAHVGITVGDFDNNGFIDVFIPRAGDTTRIDDLILLNQGDKTFTATESHGANDGFPRDETFPTGAQAFDYNKDGRIDVVVSSRLNPDLGNIHLFKNRTPRVYNYVIVQLPASILDQNVRRSTMDAVIEVTTAAGKFYRRVGSAGETRTQSFITQVHVGIGSARRVNRLRLTLTNGLKFTLRGQRINGILRIGY